MTSTDMVVIGARYERIEPKKLYQTESKEAPVVVKVLALTNYGPQAAASWGSVWGLYVLVEVLNTSLARRAQDKLQRYYLNIPFDKFKERYHDHS